MERFYSNTLKCMVQQINKTSARKVFNLGGTIYLLPSKVRFDNAWTYPCEISKKESSDIHSNFEKICMYFEVFNCGRELGQYIHFFIKES